MCNFAMAGAESRCTPLEPGCCGLPQAIILSTGMWSTTSFRAFIHTSITKSQKAIQCDFCPCTSQHSTRAAPMAKKFVSAKCLKHDIKWTGCSTNLSIDFSWKKLWKNDSGKKTMYSLIEDFGEIVECNTCPHIINSIFSWLVVCLLCKCF